MARGSSKSSGSTRKGRSGPDRDTAQTETGADSTDATGNPDDSPSSVAESALASAEEGLKDAAESVTGDDSTSAEAARSDDDADTPTGGDTAAPDEESAAGDGTVAADEGGAAGDDTIADTPPGEAGGDIDTVSTDGDETVTLSPDETADSIAADATGETTAATAEPERAAEAPPVPPPAPAPTPAPERRGGFVPLVIGGVIAAGIGYGAAYMGWLPTPAEDDPQSAAIAEALEAQSATLAELQARVSEIAGAEAPEVDLTPMLDRVEALSARLDESAGSVEALVERVAILEERPVFTGNVDEDTAAAAEAAAQLEAELAAAREAADARAAELEAAAQQAAAAAEAAAEEAAAVVAQAEAEAAEAMARAEAEAALNAVRVALETGEPFADALGTVAAAVEVPEGLSDVADSGVATPEELQAAFPPLARAALPVALQETAGEGMTDRLGAFVRGQLGGRAVEPREGDDPDAVLSRVEAAVRAGDLRTALTEITALPQGAQDVLAPWVADVEARAAAVEGLDALTGALSGSGN